MLWDIFFSWWFAVDCIKIISKASFTRHLLCNLSESIFQVNRGCSCGCGCGSVTLLQIVWLQDTGMEDFYLKKDMEKKKRTAKVKPITKLMPIKQIQN